jgi:hypothetical protein
MPAEGAGECDPPSVARPRRGPVSLFAACQADASGSVRAGKAEALLRPARRAGVQHKCEQSRRGPLRSRRRCRNKREERQRSDCPNGRLQGANNCRGRLWLQDDSPFDSSTSDAPIELLGVRGGRFGARARVTGHQLARRRSYHRGRGRRRLAHRAPGADRDPARLGP